MNESTPPNTRIEFTKRLVEGGFEDVLVLQRATAERVLTEKRMELVEEVATDDVSSVRDLARRLERDVSIVSRDLDVLFEAEVLDFERHGRSKKPVLAHENVFVEPLVFEGTVTTDETRSENQISAD